MPGKYPYNNRKETDDATDKYLYLHRCDYQACRSPATNFFKGDVRLCGEHAAKYRKHLPGWR